MERCCCFESGRYFGPASVWKDDKDENGKRSFSQGFNLTASLHVTIQLGQKEMKKVVIVLDNEITFGLRAHVESIQMTVGRECGFHGVSAKCRNPSAPIRSHSPA